MTDDTHIPTRDRLTGATTPEVLKMLPQMDKLMVFGKSGGLTFKRIGPVEAELHITFDNGTLHQSRRGQIEAARSAMGFLNVMTPDFHLHLRGGSFSGWRSAPGQRFALAENGEETGLQIAADCFA